MRHLGIQGSGALKRKYRSIFQMSSLGVDIFEHGHADGGAVEELVAPAQHPLDVTCFRVLSPGLVLHLCVLRLPPRYATDTDGWMHGCIHVFG